MDTETRKTKVKELEAKANKVSEVLAVEKKELIDV